MAQFESISRRNVLTGTAIAAASGLALGTSAASASEAQEGRVWDYETDVVVAGSGNGGMSAGISALEGGASCIIVEISTTSGGGTSFSGGSIHCYTNTDLEMYLNHTEGLVDKSIAVPYFESFMEYVPWLESLGAAIAPSGAGGANLGFNAMEKEHRVYGGREYFDSMVEIFADMGGTLLLDTAAQKILVDDDGRIEGLRCKTGDGRVLKIKAKSVVLACGGFQADPELRVRYLGREADCATIMACPIMFTRRTS